MSTENQLHIVFACCAAFLLLTYFTLRFSDSRKEKPKVMQDNKHYRAEKINGTWDFVTKDPGDYVGQHRDGPGRHPVEWLLQDN